MFKAEKKILQRLLNNLWEIEYLELELRSEDQAMSLRRSLGKVVPNPTEYGKIKTELHRSKKAYNMLLSGLKQKHNENNVQKVTKEV